jgi:hypothetical protein
MVRSMLNHKFASGAGLRRAASTPNGGLPATPLVSVRSMSRINSRSVYGAVNYARSELEEKQILAGYQAVEDLVKMTQVTSPRGSSHP